jgi:hypothetical protein
MGNPMQQKHTLGKKGSPVETLSLRQAEESQLKIAEVYGSFLRLIEEGTRQGSSPDTKREAQMNPYSTACFRGHELERFMAGLDM